MTVRFPLIVNSTTGQIGELPLGDDLSITGGNLITNATAFVGSVITTNGVFWPNGAPVANYTSSNVATYLAYGNDPTINAILANLGTITNEVYANANVAAYLVSGADPTILSIQSGLNAANTQISGLWGTVYTNANVANYLPVDPTIQKIEADILGANASIMNMYSITTAYVNSVTTAWTANAAIQEQQIALIQANASTLGTVVSNNSGNIVVLQDGMLATNVIVGGNSANIAALQTEVAGATANIELNTGYILFLENSAAYANTQISTLETALSTANLNIGNLQASMYGNANVASYLPYDFTIQSLVGNIEAANAAILSYEIVVKDYIDAVTTAWIANANIQQADISTLSSNLLTLTDTVANNTSNITALGSALTSASNLIALNTSLIGNVAANVSVLQSNVVAIDANLAATYSTFANIVADIHANVTAANTAILNNTVLIANVDANLVTLTSKVQVLDANVGNISILLANLSSISNLDVISNTLANIEASVTTLDANVGAITSNVDLLLSSYPVMDANLGIINTVVANIGQVLSFTGNAVGNLQANTGNLATRINNLDGNVGQQSIALAGAESSISTLTQEVFNNTSNISVLLTDVSTLQSVTTANTNVAAFAVSDQAGATNLAPYTWTKVTFDTVLADATASVSNSSFVPGVAGFYQLNYNIGANTFGANSGTITSSIYVNGNAYVTAGKVTIGPESTWQNAAFNIKLNATDVVEVYAMQTWTSNVTTESGINFSGAFARGV